MTSVNTKYVNGNIVYYNGQHWYDAFGPTVAKFLAEMIGEPFDGADNPARFTTTLVEAGAGETTVTLDAGEAGGAMLITTDAADNDGANLQVKGEAFKLSASKPLYFGCRFKVNEATQSDFFVGLAITDTDILGGFTDGLGFRKVDASTTVSYLVNKNTTETTATAYTCDTAYHTLEFIWDGTKLYWYVDDVLKTAIALTNLPDDEELTPSIQFLTGEAVSHIMTVDWLRCIQTN